MLPVLGVDVSLSSHFVQAPRAKSPLTARAWRAMASMLAPAGIQIDGPGSWDPKIRRARALARVWLGGTLGAGESYEAGDWECDALDEFTARMLSASADSPLGRTLAATVGRARAHLQNRQTRRLARKGITAHYDIGDDLYAAMLGPTMTYSCGYWAEAASLDAAQDAKHELICRKLQIAPGMRVLDVGCGWGGFAIYAARHYGAAVTGITISPAQVQLARQRTSGLDVQIHEMDYRDLTGQFDRVVSVGMLEHVGPRNYDAYFQALARVLAPDGLALVHAIGSIRSTLMGDPWIDRYIFPHAVLPSAAQLTRAFERRFVLEDWHNFGAYYDRTLMAWYRNFESAWPMLASRYSEAFRRRWRYYLLTCAGTFRARRNQLWQLVLSPRGVRGGYRRVAG